MFVVIVEVLVLASAVSVIELITPTSAGVMAAISMLIHSAPF